MAEGGEQTQGGSEGDGNRKRCGMCYSCTTPSLNRSCVVHGGVSDRSRKTQRRRLLTVELLSKQRAEHSLPSKKAAQPLQPRSSRSRRSGSAPSLSTDERLFPARAWSKQPRTVPTLLNGAFTVHAWRRALSAHPTASGTGEQTIVPSFHQRHADAPQHSESAAAAAADGGDGSDDRQIEAPNDTDGG